MSCCIQTSFRPRRQNSLLGAALWLALALPASGQGSSASADPPHGFGQLPLYFEANRGQSDQQVRFLARGNGSTLFLTPQEAVWVSLERVPAKHTCPCRSTHARQAREAAQAGKAAKQPEAPKHAVALRMRLIGANPAPEISGTDPLVGRVNDYTGKGRKGEVSAIPTYARVRYRAVYPGIDLVYYGNQTQLEYDFLVAPGANPNRIRLAFQGAKQIAINASGDLELSLPGGKVYQRCPILYQEVDGVRRKVAGRYALCDNKEVQFRVAAYDKHKPLVIDPVLAYATYLGSRIDQSNGIAADATGNVYVAGYTYSLSFPTKNAAQPYNAGERDAFVTKLNAAGTALVYSTYLGGGGVDYANGIAVDADGNAYVTGRASYPNGFPDIYDDYRAFVAKLSPTGSLIFFSSVPGSGDDQGNSIAIDSLGYSYVTGTSKGGYAQGFPMVNGFQTEYGGYGDAFVMIVTPDGNYIVYSTYIGGGLVDEGTGIALDPDGYVYVTGLTGGGILTTQGAFQPNYGGALGDAYVIKINPSQAGLASIVYSTYLGGDDFDQGNAIAVDAQGNAYVTGSVKSGNFPATVGSYQPGIFVSNCSLVVGKFYQCDDAFVTKLNPAGSGLVYSTYLGGKGADYANSIAVDHEGSAYLTGHAAPFFPQKEAFQSWLGGEDAFVARLSPDGSTLIFSSFLGGSGYETGTGIALDANRNIYVTGPTSSADFPTLHAYQSKYGGIQDGDSNAFIVKIGGAGNTNTATLAGTITLQACNSAAVPLTFEFRPTNANPKFTRMVTPNAAGKYTVADLPKQAFTVHIKGTRWLAKNILIDTSQGNVTGANATLLPGDANNDNSANIFDLATLAEAFNTVPADPQWNPNCDFNCDGSVDIFDLAVLAEVFNTDGDP